MILDGWGIGKHDKGDVIFKTPTPYLDYLTAVSAHSTLQTCGEDVGLPNGQMGNSEVGHLNIGAGRVVYQDLVKINKACESGDILKNQEIINAYSYAQKTGKKLHLMGLTSTGGVHSSLDHLFKLIEIGKEYGLKEKSFFLTDITSRFPDLLLQLLILRFCQVILNHAVLKILLLKFMEHFQFLIQPEA